MTAAPGAFGNREAVLVHVADGGVGMFHLGDFTERFSRVPFHHFAHCAFGMVGCRLVVEFAVKAVGIGGVGYEHTFILAGTFCHD